VCRRTAIACSAFELIRPRDCPKTGVTSCVRGKQLDQFILAPDRGFQSDTGEREDVAGAALSQGHRRAPHDILRRMNRLSVPGRRGQRAEELRSIFASSTASQAGRPVMLTERKAATPTGAPWSPVMGRPRPAAPAGLTPRATIDSLDFKWGPGVNPHGLGPEPTSCYFYPPHGHARPVSLGDPFLLAVVPAIRFFRFAFLFFWVFS
jgi:hypothetical protein